MKLGSTLINVARGSLVDEEAVAEALESHRLAAFASDVFACEDHQVINRPRQIGARLLQQSERTLFTPHLGTALIETRNELAVVQARCVLAAIKGEGLIS